jgi:hypothetical protein
VTAVRRPPRVRLLAPLFSLIAAWPAHAALQLDVPEQGLTTAEAQLSQQLISDVLDRYPAELRQRVSLQLQLRWRQDLPEHVRGRARGQTLGLDRRLLSALASADSSRDAAWHDARAALIHELAHALDRSGAGGWSGQSRFLDVAGWQQRPLLPGRGRNAFSLRSPDRYELHSPAEFFAVNFEHYLLDADFRCRRPALHAWYQSQFGAAPALPVSRCDGGLPFLQAGERDGMAELLELDPARVYQVDYLLAEGNDKLMSRWGHSMLRLVICAPGRTPGPACRMDLQHHRVLSFRAFVGDVQISSWRGLTGSYPSRLFVLPLNRVVEEYTKVELRGLSSTPLALQPREIEQLLQQAARLHWSYDGRYFFVSNNCAVETWKLLNDGVPRLAQAQLSSITPTGLLRRLRRQSLLAQVPEQRQQAISAGYYFESAAGHYAQVFEVMRHALRSLPATSVEQWLALPPDSRRAWMQQADTQVLAAMLLLEQAAWRRQELEAREVLKRRLLSGAGMAAELAQFKVLMEQAGLLLAPGSWAADGYGIPVAGEREALRRQVVDDSDMASGQWQALRARALDLLGADQRKRVAATEANLDHLRQQLRLHHGTALVPGRAAGGSSHL